LRSDLKKLNDVEFQEQYQVKMSHRFAASWKFGWWIHQYGL